MIAARRRTPGAGLRGRARRALSVIAPVIAKTFRIAKTFPVYSANFFRHNKSLRDHGGALGGPM
jgi:hypothetical protein